MYRAFFDESGLNPKEDRAFVMGGFLGSVEEWERVSDAWDACLREAPVIKYYKDSERRSLDGQFLKFNRATADAKALALAQTISRFGILGITVTASYTWFSHRDAKASKGQVGTRVYDWGFLTATSGVLQHLDVVYPGDDKIDFIFDHRPELAACINMYNQMRENPFFAATVMRRAGVCLPGDDQTIVALQMCDLLAGESCDHLNTKSQSEVFVTIRDINKIIHIPCIPPRQMPNTLRLQGLAKRVHKEATNFLRRAKKQTPDRFGYVEEVEDYISDLTKHDSYFHLEWQRHLANLSVDEDFQAFITKYLAMKKEDEFTNFDRTMRKLISVPHSEIKAKLDAEKRAKKRKAKKPSASGRASNGKG